MLQNAYFLAKIGADTAENEQEFAEILPIDRRVTARQPRRRDVFVGAAPLGNAPYQAAGAAEVKQHGESAETGLRSVD